MLRRLLLGLLALAVLPAPAAGSSRHDWSGEGTGVFRTAAYDRGEWIYTNGLWQAQGANADGLERGEYFGALEAPGDSTLATRDLSRALNYGFFGAYRASRNGDYELPRDEDRWPEGTADLAGIRLAADARHLHVRFEWNSMPRPDAQIATLTFSGGEAEVRPWPRGARLSSPWDAALTVWGTGAALTTGGADRRVAASAGDHVTEARIPLRALPAGPWTLRGGAGLADPAQPDRYWTVPPGSAGRDRPGSGGPVAPTNVWSLLFARDDPWTFDERRQSRALTSGRVDDEAERVSLRRLRSGHTSRPRTVTGDFSRVFASRLAGPDGIAKSAGVFLPPAPEGVELPPRYEGFEQTWRYTGRLQWYGMHVPERYAGSGDEWPLIVYLHGFGVSADEAFNLPVGFIAEADRRGYLVATPLGRGDSFYREDGGLDVQEVLRDVRRRYRVDPDRVYLMGHSMGGYGTHNVATRHPDRFAAIAPVQGTDSIELHRNLRHVPYLAIGSVQDLDANAEEARTMYAELSEAGQEAQLLVYDMKIHEYSSIYDTLPRLFDFFDSHRRERNPATVTWTRPSDGHRRDLGLVHDGAYWLDGIRPGPAGVGPDSGGVAGEVTVESLGIPHRRTDPARAERSEARVEDAGPSGRTRGTLYTTVPERGTPARRANVLRVEADGVVGASVDLRRARLRVTRARPLVLRVRTGEPLTLRLRRARARGGVLVVRIPAGTHTVRVRRVR